MDTTYVQVINHMAIEANEMKGRKENTSERLLLHSRVYREPFVTRVLASRADLGSSCHPKTKYAAGNPHSSLTVAVRDTGATL